MKRLKTITILFILSLLTLTSLITCKKYPQDGKFSFETPDKRIRRQPWVLTSCLVDGIDVTSLERQHIYRYNYIGDIDTLYYTLNDVTLEFDYVKEKGANGKHQKLFISFLNVKTKYSYKIQTTVSNQLGVFSKYEFNKHKNKIGFDSNAALDGLIPLFQNPTNEQWTIKKLIKTELIIETTNSNGNKIIVNFKGQY